MYPDSEEENQVQRPVQYEEEKMLQENSKVDRSSIASNEQGIEVVKQLRP